MWDQEPFHRGIAAVDIKAFADPRRDNRNRLEARNDLKRILTGSLGAADIDPQYGWEVRGDDQLLLFDAQEVARLLGPFLITLHRDLVEHNRCASAAGQIRVRMVVNAGWLVSDSNGLVGDALYDTYRILDSDQARQCLDEAASPIIVLVSDLIYREIVRHGYLGIDPSSYRQVRVRCKDRTVVAWLHVPGDPLGNGPGPRRPGGLPGLWEWGRFPRGRWPWGRRGGRGVGGAAYFTGRSRALQELVSWINDGDAPQAMVVTGNPGSGKSSLLTWLVELSHPRHRMMAPTELLGQAVDSVAPAPSSIDIALRIGGQTASEVAFALAVVAGVAARDPAAVVEELLVHGGPRVIVIDGLDEAMDPEAVAAQLLLPLAQRGGLVGVRLLVGARREVAGWFQPDAQLLDLDADTYFEPADLINCAWHHIVANAPATWPYHDSAKLARRVAVAIAARAERSFLVARLAACAAAADPELATTELGHLPQPDSVATAVDQYLATFGRDRRRATELLYPLAWVQGAGLDDADLWAELATVLSGRQYSALDVRWLVSTAGDCILWACFDGATLTYRLVHETIGEYLRGQCPADGDGGFVSVLANRVPARLGTGMKNWQAAGRYIRRYLATHAAAAGRLGELLDDAGFLAVANRHRLLAAVGRTSRAGGDDTIGLLVEEVVLRWRDTDDASRRVAYLQLTARQYGADALAEQVSQLGWSLPWTARWARWPAAVDAQRSRDASVAAVMVMQLGDGQVVACAGDGRGTIQLYDLASGGPVGRPLSSHHGTVSSLAGATLADGRRIMLSGGADGTVLLWDIDRAARGDKQAVRRLGRHGGWVTALAVAGTADGRHVALSCSVDEPTARVWDLTSDRPVGEPMAGHNKGISAVATGVLGNGQRMAVTGDLAGALRLWDLDQRSLLQELPGHTGALRTVTFAQLPGRSDVVVSSGADGAIRIWDLDRSEPVEELTAHPADRPVAAVVTTLANDQPVLVTAGEKHLVIIWDLASMSPIERIRLAGTLHGVTARHDDLILAGDRGMLALRIGSDRRTSDD
jgi:hypothetical protein